MNDENDKTAEEKSPEAEESHAAKGDGYVIPQKDKPQHLSLLATQEGCILLAGVAVALVYLIWLGIKFKVSPVEAQIMLGLTTTEVLFGRAAVEPV